MTPRKTILLALALPFSLSLLLLSIYAAFIGRPAEAIILLAGSLAVKLIAEVEE